jgi:hypothetical protein
MSLSPLQLARLVPFAAQAAATENAELLKAVLTASGRLPQTHAALACDMAVAFALGRIGAGLGGRPSFGPFVDPERFSKLIARMPESAGPLSFRFQPPPVRVYSRKDLVPASEKNARIVQFYLEPISNFRREATIDIRNIRFCHSMSEGEASRLVLEKVRSMKERLAEISKDDTEDRSPEKILRLLTYGDKDTPDRQILVGRYKDESPFLLLNGHRRISALCILALLGEIPLDWLRRIPVWFHEIAKEEAISAMTAGVDLDPVQVLGEVCVGEYCAAEALELLKFYPVLAPKIEPLDIRRCEMKFDADVAMLLSMRKRGAIDLSEEELCLTLLERLAEEAPQGFYTDTMSILLAGRLKGKESAVPRIWELIEKNGFNDLTPQLLPLLYSGEPQRVLIYLTGVLEGPVTRDTVRLVQQTYYNLDIPDRQWELLRFATHPDPMIRAFIAEHPLGQSKKDYLLRLLAMYRTEESLVVKKSIVKYLGVGATNARKYLETRGAGAKFLDLWGDGSLWKEIADILRSEREGMPAFSATTIAHLLESSYF